MKQVPLAALLLALLLASCGHKKQITITGSLENGAGKVVYIEELSPEGPLFLDSITLDSKGSFSFKYDMPYKTFYNLHVNQYDYVVLLPDFGEKIQVAGNYDSLTMTYTLKGGGDSQLLWQLQRYTNDGIRILRQLGATDRANQQMLADHTMTQAQYEVAHQTTDSIYLAAFHEQQNYVKQFIEGHPGNLASIIALYKPFNANHPLIDPKQDFEYYDLVLQGLEKDMPDNPHTLNFKNTIEHLRFQYVSQ